MRVLARREARQGGERTFWTNCWLFFVWSRRIRIIRRIRRVRRGSGEWCVLEGDGREAKAGSVWGDV
jgi:hypothetical protein